MPGTIAESRKAAVPLLGDMRGTETVLLADDHESIREMARQTLTSSDTGCFAPGTEKKRCGFANRTHRRSQCWMW